MKNLRKVSLYLLALLAFGFASCESEDPEKENEGEVINLSKKVSWFKFMKNV